MKKLTGVGFKVTFLLWFRQHRRLMYLMMGHVLLNLPFIVWVTSEGFWDNMTWAKIVVVYGDILFGVLMLISFRYLNKKRKHLIYILDIIKITEEGRK